MDLRSGQSIWLKREPHEVALATAFTTPTRCDVLVIGSGVTGALIADMLSADGMDVIVIDQRPLATGSTAASTALLMYEIDVPLIQLNKRYGWDRAERCYRASVHALQMLVHTIRGLGEACEFSPRKSLYLARGWFGAKRLQRECEARRRCGIDVDLLDQKDIQERFPFSAPAALLSHAAAEVNPVQLTQCLLKRAQSHGARLFHTTRATHIHPTTTNMVVATGQGSAIHARYVIVACGYESGAFLDKAPGSLHSSFVACSVPMNQRPLWHEQWLIWEMGRPYVYLRTTYDGRAIIGGADVPFKNATARDAMLPKRQRALERRFAKMFPELPFETECAWAGTFGESADGLPYIGAASHPRCLFAMGYGGNGITWGMMAAEIIQKIVHGQRHPDAELFAFSRC